MPVLPHVMEIKTKNEYVNLCTFDGYTKDETLDTIIFYLFFLLLCGVLSGLKYDVQHKKCQKETCKIAKCKKHNESLCHAYDGISHVCRYLVFLWLSKSNHCMQFATTVGG